MLDLHRLRLLHELHARGTIAAVADALQFTPSAVSQQLAVLEREAGVDLLEPAGRGVRLTDAALVLVGHAGALLERAELAQAELAAAAGDVAGTRTHRDLPVDRAEARRAGDAGACAGGARAALRARRGGARGVAAGARARRRRSRAGRRVAAPAASASDGRHARGPAPRSRPARASRAATRQRGAGGARCRSPSSQANAWTTGHPGTGLGGDRDQDLPRARRLRSGHPPPHQRQRHEPRARGRLGGP